MSGNKSSGADGVHPRDLKPNHSIKSLTQY